MRFESRGFILHEEAHRTALDFNMRVHPLRGAMNEFWLNTHDLQIPIPTIPFESKEKRPG
jgi:hypothetical protein